VLLPAARRRLLGRLRHLYKIAFRGKALTEARTETRMTAWRSIGFRPLPGDASLPLRRALGEGDVSRRGGEWAARGGMPSFRWSALNGDEVVHGVMEAADRRVVVEKLQRQGQIVLRAELAGGRRSLLELLQIELGGARGLDKAALAELTRELATMLAAGLDLDRTLRFVSENIGNSRARAILGAIRDKVRAGSSLAAALSSEPKSFPRLYTGLVRAGEAGGTLAPTLERLAALLEKERSLSASLRAALVYPALLVVAAGLSIVLLLEFVLPQFAPLFAEAGAKLPAPTRILMALGKGLGVAGPWLLIAFAAAALLVRRLLSNPTYRLRADRMLLSVPVIGRLLRETVAARLARTLGSLLQNGMPLIPALGIAKDALGNLAVAAAVEKAALAAKGGAGLARSLGESGLLPARTIHLLQLGEEAAQLAAMALKAADIHDEQARLMMQRLVSLTVPVITITMGLIVAGIIGALVAAMLSLNELVS
jgi:general secretion pathway protein F